MLHKSEPASSICDVDEGQKTVRALSDERYSDHEQWLTPVYTRQSESPGTVHLYAVQCARHTGLLR